MNERFKEEMWKDTEGILWVNQKLQLNLKNLCLGYRFQNFTQDDVR